MSSGEFKNFLHSLYKTLGSKTNPKVAKMIAHEIVKIHHFVCDPS
jgi:hypothetical protein